MYKEVPMLRFLTFTRFVRILWSEYDVEDLMTKYFLGSDQTDEKWRNIELAVESKIGNTSIPILLKIQLANLIKPIGSRIKHIIKQIYDNVYLPNHFTSILNWTLLGTIDAKKTVKAVLKDENLHLTKRYELACTHCLEDEISIIWSKLSETYKNYYLCEGNEIYVKQFLPIYWAYCMKAEINRFARIFQELLNKSLNPHGFEDASVKVNQSAVEYFLRKLNMEEKGTNIAFFLQFWEYTAHITVFFEHEKIICDIIYFLLSQMNEIQRTSIFQNYAYLILRHFLEFPYRGLFLELESKLQQYLTQNQKMLLDHIRYSEGYNYFLFRTFSKH